MPYINNVEIAGNLGKDAKSSTTKSRKQVTRFSIASNKRWTDKAGEEHETTDWFRVAAWGSLTKFANSLKQGDPVWSKESSGPASDRRSSGTTERAFCAGQD